MHFNGAEHRQPPLHESALGMAKHQDMTRSAKSVAQGLLRHLDLNPYYSKMAVSGNQALYAGVLIMRALLFGTRDKAPDFRNQQRAFQKP